MHAEQGVQIMHDTTEVNAASKIWQVLSHHVKVESCAICALSKQNSDSVQAWPKQKLASLATTAQQM